MLSHLKVHSIFFFNYRKCHHDKLLKHITSILGRGLYPLIELDGKRMGVGRGGPEDGTSTEKQGKRSREQETKTPWHSGNRREWEHKVVASDLCRQAYQQRARRRARRPVPSVSNHFLLPLFLYPCDFFCFLLIKNVQWKRGVEIQLCLYSGTVQLLKGTLFMFSLWFAGTPFS